MSGRLWGGEMVEIQGSVWVLRREGWGWGVGGVGGGVSRVCVCVWGGGVNV